MSSRFPLIRDYYPSKSPLCPVSPASGPPHPQPHQHHQQHHHQHLPQHPELWIGEETKRALPPHVYKYYLNRTRCYRRQSLKVLAHTLASALTGEIDPVDSNAELIDQHVNTSVPTSDTVDSFASCVEPRTQFDLDNIPSTSSILTSKMIPSELLEPILPVPSLTQKVTVKRCLTTVSKVLNSAQNIAVVKRKAVKQALKDKQKKEKKQDQLRKKIEAKKSFSNQKRNHLAK
ncbi:unnamed protein product [Diabrotica balteata]|uniref:Uncharacterized protein n=1 Tax=Diabrotica balteata TaxID=107213 RepID=A0A9N9SV05_DIABA|nr:unnamed protein product [Diabrotica balteata]